MDRSASIAEANSLFEQPWWLEAVAPGEWEAAVVRDQDRLQARLTYQVRKNRWGHRLLVNPPLTPMAGPWMASLPGKYPNRLGREHRVLTRLLEGLPACDCVELTLDPALTNALAFHWAGYACHWRCTYRIADLSSLDRVMWNYTGNARRLIRKAEQKLEVRDDLSMEVLFKVLDKMWERQGAVCPHNRRLLERVDQACLGQGARLALFAVDAQSRVHGAVYIVHDQRAAYYLMGGADPELRPSGAQYLLLHRAIERCAKLAPVFDFEGTMLSNVEHAFRSFGAAQTPLLRVERMSPRYARYRAVRTWTDGPRRWRRH